MVVELILGTLLATGALTPEPAAPVATPAAVVANSSEAEPEADPDPVICRTRMVPQERVGARFRRVEDCRTRSEWNGSRGTRSRR